jgi:hypothetical protein
VWIFRKRSDWQESGPSPACQAVSPSGQREIAAARIKDEGKESDCLLPLEGSFLPYLFFADFLAVFFAFFAGFFATFFAFFALFFTATVAPLVSLG